VRAQRKKNKRHAATKTLNARPQSQKQAPRSAFCKQEATRVQPMRNPPRRTVLLNMQNALKTQKMGTAGFEPLNSNPVKLGQPVSMCNFLDEM
jgi:hypothetical protein